MKKNIAANSLKVIFPAKSVNEALARMIIAAFVSRLDPTIDELADIKTAVSEAVTNSVIHGYGGGGNGGEIIMQAFCYDDNMVKVVIKDKGMGIENIKRAMEPFYTSDPTGERGGMGFSIMQNFTDKLKIRSSPGKGTVVTLEKMIGKIHKN